MISELYPKAIKLDGFDDCVIGIHGAESRIVYDQDKIIEKLKLEMSEEEAIEYFDYNISGAYFGPKTPLYIEVMDM